jgi:hypothetical protein
MRNDKKNDRILQLGKWLFPVMLLLDFEDFVFDCQFGFVKDYPNLEMILGIVFSLSVILNYTLFYVTLKSSFSTLGQKFSYVLISFISMSFWLELSEVDELFSVLFLVSVAILCIFYINFGFELYKEYNQISLNNHLWLIINFLVLSPLQFMFYFAVGFLNYEIHSNYISFVSLVWNVTETVILFKYFDAELKQDYTPYLKLF